MSAHASDPARRAVGPLLLVLDGNSLTHRAYHAAATGRLLDEDDRPVWAIKGLIGYLARAAGRLRPDAVMIGFDCPDASVRKVAFPGYKAHRPPKPADLVWQLLQAPGTLRDAGLATVVVTAHEADDVLASGAALARREGWRAVVMTSDRDAFALIDETTSVLRVRNGGFDEAVLVTPEALVEVYGVHPTQYPDYAALRGDPSDNLPGVRGFGSATSARLLAAFGTLDAALDADIATVRSVVGEAAANHLASAAAREILARNRGLMRLRGDLPLPDLDSARIPVDRATMRRAFAERGIYLGPSLWALTGTPPPQSAGPAEDVVRVPRPWVWRRSPRANRAPAPGQLALF